MSDILKEIKELDKEAQLNNVLGKSALGIFVFGAFIVICLGLFSWYENRKNEKIQEDGAILTQLVHKINYSKAASKDDKDIKKLEEEKKPYINKLEKLAEAQSSAYSALANIYLASLALLEGNASKGVYYYQRIARDSFYPEHLREYATLVEINTKLQFNNEVHETPMKQIHEYFAPYIQENKIKPQLLYNKQFSDGMALTGIALEDKTGVFDNTMLYFQALDQHEGHDENTSFIIDILSEYISQKKQANESK